MGLAFDEEDFDYYLTLFRDDIGRDPTNVELFDMGQSNSEHWRATGFFGGNLIVDGVPQPGSLFKMVKETIAGERGHNSVIASGEGQPPSGAIRGIVANTPSCARAPGEQPQFARDTRLSADLGTSSSPRETHNFLFGVAAYPGAETGAGGRARRDTHATGIGSLLTAGTAGYCVGNLQIPDNVQPHEDKTLRTRPTWRRRSRSSSTRPTARAIMEQVRRVPYRGVLPTALGSALPNGERREWIKPIMFSGGFGQIDHSNLEKQEGDVGMLVVKIGGPAYRIGMAAAPSSKAGGEDEANADLDFNAVQRGDAEMSNKLNRVVKACVELEGGNPILSIHDQGAGGNCNVCKELIYPKGGELNIRAVKLGDATLSVLEIWGAEYQWENSAMLIAPESLPVIEKICARERCPFSVLGSIDGSGRVKLVDPTAPEGAPIPEDLDPEKVSATCPRRRTTSSAWTSSPRLSNSPREPPRPTPSTASSACRCAASAS